MSDDSPRRKLKLVEQLVLVNPATQARGKKVVERVKTDRISDREAGPVHPIGAQRERHRLEHERRFGGEIVERAAGLVMNWSEGRMLLIAEPRLLGLMRERLRQALRRTIKLEELAKGYSGLSTAELERLFVSQRLLP